MLDERGPKFGVRFSTTTKKMQLIMMKFGFVLLLLVLPLASVASQTNVLVVMAHADDETAMAGGLFKMAKQLEARVDLAVVTNGQGGYKYASVGEFYYRERLASMSAGRRRLPRVRKWELLESAKVLGIENVFFLAEPDVEYTTNVTLPLDVWWDTALVSRQLGDLLGKQPFRYDFVFAMLPAADEHGEHKAATILALEAVEAMRSEAERPSVLGVRERSIEYEPVPGYPITATVSPRPSYEFDRRQTFGYSDKLNYQLPAALAIAAHKSQGSTAMALVQPPTEIEFYWPFALNEQGASASHRRSATEQLFSQLARAQFVDWHCQVDDGDDRWQQV
jgi:N-acetylglucosamine malate deacetylase 2